jgi:hypothetical protein
MGADLLLAYVWTRSEELDWEAGDGEIDLVRSDDIPDLNTYGSEDNQELDDEEFIEKVVHPELHAKLARIREAWDNPYDHREVCFDNLGPLSVLATGGMSWGDSPTELFDDIIDMPSRVMHAIGFYG